MVDKACIIDVTPIPPTYPYLPCCPPDSVIFGTACPYNPPTPTPYPTFTPTPTPSNCMCWLVTNPVNANFETCTITYIDCITGNDVSILVGPGEEISICSYDIPKAIQTQFCGTIIALDYGYCFDGVNCDCLLTPTPTPTPTATITTTSTTSPTTTSTTSPTTTSTTFTGTTTSTTISGVCYCYVVHYIEATTTTTTWADCHCVIVTFSATTNPTTTTTTWADCHCVIVTYHATTSTTTISGVCYCYSVYYVETTSTTQPTTTTTILDCYCYGFIIYPLTTTTTTVCYCFGFMISSVTTTNPITTTTTNNISTTTTIPCFCFNLRWDVNSICYVNYTDCDGNANQMTIGNGAGTQGSLCSQTIPTHNCNGVVTITPTNEYCVGGQCLTTSTTPGTTTTTTCSCYEANNIYSGNQTIVYLDCDGIERTITIPENTIINFCSTYIASYTFVVPTLIGDCSVCATTTTILI